MAGGSSGRSQRRRHQLRLRCASAIACGGRKFGGFLVGGARRVVRLHRAADPSRLNPCRALAPPDTVASVPGSRRRLFKHGGLLAAAQRSAWTLWSASERRLASARGGGPIRFPLEQRMRRSLPFQSAWGDQTRKPKRPSGRDYYFQTETGSQVAHSIARSGNRGSAGLDAQFIAERSPPKAKRHSRSRRGAESGRKRGS